MKVLILGSGAMGSIFGGYLKKAGEDVVLLDAWAEHVAAINSQGLQIEGPDGKTVNIPAPAVTSCAGVGNIDLVIVFVKSYHTDQALASIQSVITPATRILTLQNGLGNGDKLVKYAGSDRVYVGGTQHGGLLKGPGIIKHRATGETYIGKLSGGKDEFLLEMEQMFRRAGFAVKALEDTSAAIWSKLLINVAFNALTALTHLKNKDFVAQDEGKKLMAMVVAEAVKIAEAKGIALAYEQEPIDYMVKIGSTTIGENTTSMLNDILNGRLTEVEVINGAIVAEGKKLGIPTPVNETVTLLINALHNTYDLQLKPAVN